MLFVGGAPIDDKAAGSKKEVAAQGSPVGKVQLAEGRPADSSRSE